MAAGPFGELREQLLGAAERFGSGPVATACRKAGANFSLTLQSNLKELPDRIGTTKQAVNSLGLIGKALPGGRVLTKDTLDAWVESLLAPQGVTSGPEDATVYDWTKTTSASGSLACSTAFFDPAAFQVL